MPPKTQPMKRPAAATAGLQAIEALKRARLEKSATAAPPTPDSAYDQDVRRGGQRSAMDGRRSPAEEPAWRRPQAAAAAAAALPAAPLARAPVAAAPVPAAAAAAAATRAQEAECRAAVAEAIAAADARTAAAEARVASLQARVDTQEARLRELEVRAQKAEKLEGENMVLRRQAEDLSSLLNSKVDALTGCEKRVSHAEGRAETLADQAKTAADAVERAARAEERAEVMYDLKKKLPLLIRHCTSAASLSSPGFRVGALPKTIKLEIDDRRCVAEEEQTLAVTDPYGTEPQPPPKPAARPAPPHPASRAEGRDTRSASRERRNPPSQPTPCQTPSETQHAPRGRSGSRERQRSAGAGAEQGGRSSRLEEGASLHASGMEDSGSRAGLMQRAMSALTAPRSRQMKL